MDWAGLFGLTGMVALTAAMILLGLLSKRMARATRTPAYYRGFYAGALFIGLGALARLFILTKRVAPPADFDHNIVWVLLYNGAPTLGITLGVLFAWRYWSWLLAERA